MYWLCKFMVSLQHKFISVISDERARFIIGILTCVAYLLQVGLEALRYWWSETEWYLDKWPSSTGFTYVEPAHEPRPCAPCLSSALRPRRPHLLSHHCRSCWGCHVTCATFGDYQTWYCWQQWTVIMTITMTMMCSSYLKHLVVLVLWYLLGVVWCT